MGHDMAEQALLKKKAKMLILCSDVSPRLVNEFKKTIDLHNLNVPVHQLDITINEIHCFVGYKAGVLTVNDENFSNKIISLINQEGNANGS